MRSSVVLLGAVGTATALNLAPGLEGTRSAAGDGLTDKQLGLLNFFLNATSGSRDFLTAADAAAAPDAYGWGNEQKWFLDAWQTGLFATRYQLAFMSYAAAALGAAHTPAFPALTARILRDAFARLVHPQSWQFWDTPGVCGEPWTKLCAVTNLSMCELNLAGRRASWCPDPVKWQNVMYSGHLAHVGALYEALTAEYSLTSAGWAFFGAPNRRRRVPPIKYTLPKLLDAIHAQTRLSRTGGFACEPTVVYLVCNQHTYAAAKLYDATFSTGGRYSSEGGKWLRHLNATARRRRPRGPLGEGFFEILYQEQLRDVFKEEWVEIADVAGCAANDGWALTALSFWAADDARGRSLVAGGRASVAANSGWRDGGALGGAFLFQSYVPYGYMKYTSQLATSFAPVALGGWDGDHERRVSDAFTYMEALSGTAFDSDGDGEADAYFYDTDAHPDESTRGKRTHLRMWATANLALGTTFDPAVTAALYDGSLAKRALSQPHLLSTVPPAPKALVRRAVFEQERGEEGEEGGGTLQLTLLSSSSASLKGVRLTIAVPVGWRRANATAIGTPPTPSSAARTFDISVDIRASEDTAVNVSFVRT